MAVVGSGEAGLVEEMSEETDSSNEEDDVTIVVCCVVDTGATVVDVDCVFVVGAAGATVGVVAAAGGVDAGAVDADVVAAAGDVDTLLEVVASGVNDVVAVAVAVVAEVTVCVWPLAPRRPPTPFNKPPTTPPLGGGGGGGAAIAAKNKNKGNVIKVVKRIGQPSCIQGTASREEKCIEAIFIRYSQLAWPLKKNQKKPPIFEIDNGKRTLKLIRFPKVKSCSLIVRPLSDNTRL